MPTITRDANLCAKCGICVLTCPASVYVQETRDSIPEAVNIESCVSCGHCVAVCPKDAIIHSEFPGDRVTPINREILPSPEGALEFMRTRRSIRIFKDQPVERQLIEGIIEAARYAPSFHNAQSTEFIVVQDREMLESIVQATCSVFTKALAQLRNPVMRQILSIIIRRQVGITVNELIPSIEHIITEIQGGKDIVLHHAPALILFHADKRDFFVDINAQLALQNATLMAHARGLGSFYTSYIIQACERGKAVQQLVSLPENHKIYGGLAVGYPRFQDKKWPERRTPKITWM